MSRIDKVIAFSLTLFTAAGVEAATTWAGGGGFFAYEVGKCPWKSMRMQKAAHSTILVWDSNDNGKLLEADAFINRFNDACVSTGTLVSTNSADKFIFNSTEPKSAVTNTFYNEPCQVQHSYEGLGYHSFEGYMPIEIDNGCLCPECFPCI